MHHHIFKLFCGKMLFVARGSSKGSSKTIAGLFILICFVMLIGTVEVTEGKSTAKRQSANSRWIPYARYRRNVGGRCGSRLVDVLNVLCRSRFYEPTFCKIAKRHYCLRGRGQGHPICLFRCGSARTKRSTDALSGSDEAENYSPQLALLHSVLAEQAVTTESPQTKSKRNIHAISMCCYRECPVDDLKRYCRNG